MNAYELRKKRDLAPYNESMQDICTIYDHLSYTMDVDICSREEHKVESGNVIKGFRCIISNIFTIPVKE